MQVKLLPWTHDFNSKNHAELIRLVSELPKNSIIALELVAGQDAYFEAYKNYLLDKPISQTFVSSQMQKDIEELKNAQQKQPKLEVSREVLAVLELQEAIHKRNITIVPIETPISFNRIRKNFPVSSADATTNRINEKREEVMVRQIQAYLKKPRKKTLYVITGFGHTASLHQQLSKLGIDTQIILDPFTNQDNIKERVEQELVIREKVRKGLLSAAYGIRNKLFEIASLQRRDISKAKQQLFQSLHQRDQQARKPKRLRKPLKKQPRRLK